MELPPSLGPRTKLGILGHLLTCIGMHTKLWVWSLGTARKVLGTQDQPTYGPASIMCY